MTEFLARAAQTSPSSNSERFFLLRDWGLCVVARDMGGRGPTQLSIGWEFLKGVETGREVGQVLRTLCAGRCWLGSEKEWGGGLG